MKKGINIWSFPNQPLKDSFAIAKDAGFEGVEPALALDGEISLTTSERDLMAIARCANDMGLEMYSLSSGLYWDFWLNDSDRAKSDKAKDIVRRQLECAKALGCDTILVIPGSVNAEFAAPGKVEDYATAYDRSLEAMCELKESAEEYKVSIGLENVWNKFLLSPLEMRDFIDKIGSDYVGAYFDVGNTALTGYPEQWIKILGKRIKKVHFKDFRREVGNLDGFVDLLAGDVNYPAVKAALDGIGYDGWVSAEMIPSYKHYSEAIIYNTSYSMDKILGRK